MTRPPLTARRWLAGLIEITASILEHVGYVFTHVGDGVQAIADHLDPRPPAPDDEPTDTAEAPKLTWARVVDGDHIHYVPLDDSIVHDQPDDCPCGPGHALPADRPRRRVAHRPPPPHTHRHSNRGDPMIRQWLTARTTRTDHSNQLRAAGLTTVDIRDLHVAGLDPLKVDFSAVLAAAQIGTPPHEITDHVRAAYHVAMEGTSVLEALGLTGRLHVWGVPYDHAATLISHIARATEGA